MYTIIQRERPPDLIVSALRHAIELAHIFADLKDRIS